jgi:hypothetical protein
MGRRQRKRLRLQREAQAKARLVLEPMHIQTIGVRRGPGLDLGPLPEGRCGASGKRQFATEEQALAWLAVWQEQGGWRKSRAYYCPACPYWHISSRFFDDAA